MHFSRIAFCLLVSALLCAVCAAVPAPEAKKDQSVVSRLDPALRKALLEALTNLRPLDDEDADDADVDDQTTDDSVSTEESSTDYAATTTADDLIGGDESVTSATTPAKLNDQVPSVQYHSYVVDNVGENESDNEIIRTIIVKASDKQLSDNKVTDDDDDADATASDNQVGDGKPLQQIDPIKENDGVLLLDNVQIARSVASGSANEISAAAEAKPKSTAAASTTTITPPTPTTKPIKFKTTTSTTTTTTTTEAPTHNEDGENIERVRADEVSISQAPLVTAFTIQQDLAGRPNGIIAHHNIAHHQQQAQQLLSFAPSPLLAQRDATPSNAFDVAQSRLQLEQQVAYLQQQQRQQEALFREQQLNFDRDALQRQQSALLEQRLRIEQDYRLKQQQYEQEIRAYRQQQAAAEARKNIQLKHLQFVEQHRQQQQQQQFVQAPPAVHQTQQFNSNVPVQQQQQQQLFVQQLPAVQQQHVFQHEQQQQQFLRPTAQVQIVPSVAFGSIATQQLLPAKSAVDFQQSNQHSALQFQAVPFVQTQQQQQQQQPLQLSSVQELPQRAFQQFQPSVAASSQSVEIQSAVGTAFPPSIETVVPRTRQFRQESGTGNFGFNNNNERYLQSFLSQSSGVNGGIGGGVRGGQTEDFNIITKVLALNHGIPNAQSFLGRSQF